MTQIRLKGRATPPSKEQCTTCCRTHQEAVLALDKDDPLPSGETLESCCSCRLRGATTRSGFHLPSLKESCTGVLNLRLVGSLAKWTSAGQPGRDLWRQRGVDQILPSDSRRRWSERVGSSAPGVRQFAGLLAVPGQHSRWDRRPGQSRSWRRIRCRPVKHAHAMRVRHIDGVDYVLAIGETGS